MNLADCCEADQVCISDSCKTPGEECVEDSDCPNGFYCEETMNKCLEKVPSNCEAIPDFDDVQLDHVDWYWDGGQIITIPVIADLDGDKAPEVIVGTSWELYQSNPNLDHGRVVVLKGNPATKKGEVLLELNESGGNHGSSGRSTVAVGDVDGDGHPDIIYAGRKTNKVESSPPDSGQDSLIWAYSYAKKQYLWSSHQTQSNGTTKLDYKMVVHNGAITVANLDDDPAAEIIIGASIIDNDGEVVWDQANKGSTFGSAADYVGGIAAVADIAGDTRPEIISGRHAWRISAWEAGAGNGGTAKVTVTELWDADNDAINPGFTIKDGYPAVADLNLDGKPEVVLTADGALVILDAATGKLWCSKASCTDAERTQPYALPGNGDATSQGKVNHGGPATIADFDGDKRPEIGLPDFSYYAVYDINRTIGGMAETIPVSAIPTMPGAGQMFTRWRFPTQDHSSSATGSSVFDFQGDGKAEVVYADECYARVFDGETGKPLGEVPNSTATIHDYPVVADVDGDGRTEVLVVANDKYATGCESSKRHGLYVYGDPLERWVPTRRVWTQHTYHVTNSDSTGNVPKDELNNWLDASLNNYRQNRQGYGAFNLPDLQVSLSHDLSMCSMEKMKVTATIRNAGARGAPAGIDINLYQGVNSSGKLVGNATTTKILLPGATEKVVFTPSVKPGIPVSFYVAVDGTGVDVGDITECLEDNNTSVVVNVACPSSY
jgi:hypothetical protein